VQNYLYQTAQDKLHNLLEVWVVVQTSVNFNINTLDARGFDELLVRNRGTITQIINSAVNERGAKSLI
jgi:hypothetical protein